MLAESTQRVLAALTAQSGQVRFVGGCVRDAVLRRPIRDIDIASHDPPERVMALLAQAGITAIPTGIAHGTVTAVIGRDHFEITTLRQDVETFGRHARVAFTDDWTADAARRDFTMNAMFADAEGNIFDPFDGLADLGYGRVRFVGEPLKRIEEDVLRLLRFFRFHAHYGRPPMDRAALAACRRMAPQLSTLSGERVAGEMLRLLAATDPASVLLVMQGEHVLEHVLPEARDIGRLRVLCWLESRALARPTITPDPMRRLAALLETDAAGAATVAERLKLSNQEKDRLVAIAAPQVTISAEMDAPTARRGLRRVGVETFRDLILTAWADQRSRDGRPSSAETARWMGLLDLADAWVPVTLPVRGQDCIDLGIERGPSIGALLAEVERWWEEKDFQPDREACLGRLKRLVG